MENNAAGKPGAQALYCSLHICFGISNPEAILRPCQPGATAVQITQLPAAPRELNRMA